MRDQERLCFEAGPLRFCVDAPPDLDDHITSMFSGFRRLHGDSGAAEVFEITTTEEVGARQWSISGPNVPLYPLLDRSLLLDALVAGVNLSILDADAEALHLHAAAMATNGRAAVVVGASGSGKTTLAATLALAGWDYITDEMVRLSPDESAITGFAKPLSVRSSGADLLKLTSGAVSTSDGEAYSVQVSPERLGARAVGGSTPCVLLFLSGSATGQRGAQPVARSLSHADAVVALMGQTMDAERFGERAVEVLSRLAGGCRCFSFEVGVPESMTELINGIMDEDAVHVPPLVEVLPASGRITEGILTVLIGDEAVVHDRSSGLVVALDAMAATIWQRLAGSGSAYVEVDLEAPVESKFVAQLVSMGLAEHG